MTSTWLVDKPAMRGRFTGERDTPFFQLLNHRCGADAQHPGRIAYPTAIEAHVDHLLALTVGTSDRNEGHRFSFHEKGEPWHTFQRKYRSVTPPRGTGALVFSE